MALMSLKEEDCTADIKNLTVDELSTLADWERKYKEKGYPVVGKLVENCYTYCWYPYCITQCTSNLELTLYDHDVKHCGTCVQTNSCQCTVHTTRRSYSNLYPVQNDVGNALGEPSTKA